MKTRRLFVILLSVLVTFALIGFTVACSSEEDQKPKSATVLTIDSKTEATIEVGAEYTLIYTCDGEVTVKVTGDTAASGTYNKETKKFSATAAGVYTLEVTGTQSGKAPTTKTVKITVVAGADKTALAEALERAKAYTISTDYTADSWANLVTAKTEAQRVLDGANETAAVIANTLTLVNNAIGGLTPAPITKATVATGKITVATTEYLAEDYKNFTEVATKVTALNNNTEIKLISEYNAELNKILGELVDNVTLTVSGAPVGKVFLTDIALAKEYAVNATSEAGANVSWKVNGAAVTVTGNTYNFKPTQYGEYTIEVTAEKDGASRTRTYQAEFVEAYYSANTDGVAVENGVIKVTRSIEWNDNEGKNATIPDIVLSGDFTVYFDLKFTEKPGDSNNANVMALFILNASNLSSLSNWLAVRGQDNQLEIAYDGGGRKPLVQMPAGTTDVDKTMHFMFARRIDGNNVYYTAALLDDDGNVITVHDGGGDKASYTGDVVFGINAEHSSFEVSNFRVDSNATIALNKSLLHNAIAASESCEEMDYTEATYTAMQTALTEANTVYGTRNKTQQEVDEATAALKAALAGLEQINVNTVKATVDESDEIKTFTYAGETYASDDYKNFDDILDAVKSLNAGITEDDDMLVSQYDAQIGELIAQLIPSLDVTVAGAPEGTLIVKELISYTLTATTDGTDEDVVWKLNGEQVATGDTYTFNPAEFDTEYTIVATASKDEKTATKTIVSKFVKADFQVNNDKLEVVNNTINVKDNGTGWDDQKGRKVVLQDLNLHGEFVVTMDVNFVNDAIMGVFLLTQDGINIDNDDNRSYYVVINRGSHFLGVGINQGGGEPHNEGIPDEAIAMNTTFTLRVSRYYADGKWWLKGEVINAAGEVVKEGAREDCTNGNATLGFQSETGMFTVSNIKLVSGVIIDRKVMTAAKENCDDIDGQFSPDEDKLLINFGNDDNQIQNYRDARKEIYDAYYTPDSSPERIESAIAAFNANYTALMAVKINVANNMAVVDETNRTITYKGNEYNSLYYTNIDDVIAAVKTVNGGTYGYMTEYEAALNIELAKLTLALEVTVTSVDGIADNSVIIDWTGKTYAFNVSGAIQGVDDAEFAYAWKLDGEDVEGTTAAYTLTPTQGTHTLEAFVTYGEGENAMTVSKAFTVAFEKANVNTHTGRVTDNNDGTYTVTDGSGWGEWEGRKVVFDELVFNGSFSAQMDVTFDTKVGGANVVTFHLLNADTLSRDTERDKAVIGWGCICLHETPIRLETAIAGDSTKKQSNAEGYGSIEAALSAAGTNLDEGKTFTIKLDVYKNKNNQLSYDVSVLVDGEWITFARENEWYGDFGSGAIIGVNVENAVVTLGNFKFSLLEAGTRGDNGVEYIAGSVKSKADLYNAYTQYKSVDASEYVNGGAFVNAYYAAYEALCDNTANADYVTAYNALKAAYEALTLRTAEFAPTVAGLDKGYNNYMGYDKFTATDLPTGATEVKWTYGFLAATEGAEVEAKTVNGAELALANGKYTDVTLHFTVDGTEHTFLYQNFTVAGLSFRVVDNRVTVNDNGTVDMTPIAWDDPLEQLVINGLKPHEFEFSVDVKYMGGDVMVFRLGERDVQMVVRFDHEGHSEIGFDEFKNDGGYVTTSSKFATGSTYTFKISAIKNDVGEYNITFSAYDDQGNLLASKTRNNTYRGVHFDETSTWTDFNITSEHVTCTFSNFKVMYN